MTTDVAWKRRENYGCNLRNVQRILVMFSSIMFGEVDNESPFTRTEAELLEQLELWTNQKIFWWRRQTYVLMDDRDQILMLSVFSWICLDHQLAFPLPMVPARYQTLGFTKLSSVQSITCPQRVLPKPYARTIFSVAQNLKHSQYDQSFSHPFTALLWGTTQREGRYL